MTERPTVTASSVPPVAWHISTKSDAGSGNCVEVGPVLDGTGRVAVRDSKDRDGAVLLFGSSGWRAFLIGVRTRPSWSVDRG